jgi:hypothetical protein
MQKPSTCQFNLLQSNTVRDDQVVRQPLLSQQRASTTKVESFENDEADMPGLEAVQILHDVLRTWMRQNEASSAIAKKTVNTLS